MRKLRMLRKYIRLNASPLDRVLNTVNIITAYIGIPAIVFHELSHLFFILLFGAKWNFGERCFLKPARRDGKLTLKTCFSFGMSPRRYWHGVIVGLSPMIATMALFASTFWMPNPYNLYVVLYILLFFSNFKPSNEDLESVAKCWYMHRHENESTRLREIAAFAEKECGISQEEFCRKFKEDPRALFATLKTKASALKAEHQKQAEAFNSDTAFDQSIADLKRKIQNN